MTTMTVDQTAQKDRLGLIPQIFLIIWQNLLTILRRPEAVIPPIGISLFFLFIYDSTLGRASGFIPDLGTNDYLGFILPLSIVSSSLSGSGIAAQNLVRNIENGYFDKLLLTPIYRFALLTGTILAGAVILGVQASIVVGMGLVLGLEVATGALGILAVIALAMLLGLGFSGFTMSAALGSGNAAVTQSANFVFFPLTFLAPTFVPLDLLDGWLKTVARINPITYVMEAMRALLNTGWDPVLLFRGVLATVILGGLMYLLTLFALRVRTRRA